MNKNYSFPTGNEVMVNFERWRGLVHTFLSTWEASLMLPPEEKQGEVLGRFLANLEVCCLLHHEQR